MDLSNADALIVRNPATGKELARVSKTPVDDVSGLVAQAQASQHLWRLLPIRDRIAVVKRFWLALARNADTIANAVRDEIGKPLPEAQFEVVAALDSLRWTVKNAKGVLADRRIGPGWQRFALMGPSRLRWKPLGVVGIVGTWNYPVLLDAPAIAQAIIAGNGVAWKPSELCVGVASHLRDCLDEAGVPAGLVATLMGGPEIGRAMIESGLLAKGFFTGGLENGRSIQTSLARQSIPSVMELSGFDPAIVLPDSPLEATAKALTWASFVGAGQTCVAVKRIYVVGDAQPWADATASLAKSLRVGDPASENIDIGPMISDRARERFHATILRAIDAGAKALAGGRPIDGPGWFYEPTVLLATNANAENVLEGVFGPVVVIRSVADDDAAIQAANASNFGLAASVWGRDRKRCRAIAARIDAGMVTINDAVTPSGLAASPFGGTKRSGFGRVRGAIGLREFVEPQTHYERSPGGFRPHLFPYSANLGRILNIYRRWFHS